ncbi:hypothetical protein J4G37_20165 [Microvirga sp. 3-52]|nr:hypothetical protein [Microvirga sp. 3-52]
MTGMSSRDASKADAAARISRELMGRNSWNCRFALAGQGPVRSIMSPDNFIRIGGRPLERPSRALASRHTLPPGPVHSRPV